LAKEEVEEGVSLSTIGTLLVPKVCISSMVLEN
jgi:hypothetical protein